MVLVCEFLGGESLIVVLEMNLTTMTEEHEYI